MDNFSMEAPRKRPLGVSIIAVLVAIEGIFGVFLGIFALLGAIFGRRALPPGSALAGFILAIVALGIGLVLLFFVWGLWTLKRWAFWTTLVIVVVDLAVRLIALALPSPSGGLTVYGLILPVAVLLYFLVDPNVRKAFLS